MPFQFNFERGAGPDGDGERLRLNVPWKRQMFSLQGGVTWYAQAPQQAPAWGLRFTLTLLYPRR